VKEDVIFQKEKWQGLKTDDLNHYVDLIKNNYEFKRRGDVESDPSYQQIIPYILFSARGGSASGGSDKFFAYKYIKKAGEKRLINNECQLGIGGHINKEDVNESKDVLETGMMREWLEEVDFKGNILEKRLVGILNDESREVEKVHLGLVYHFVGDNPDIQIKETEKMEGKLIDLNEVINNTSHSPWTKIVCDNYLSKLN
jgi:predicted NUDIX family phosphoesterase